VTTSGTYLFAPSLGEITLYAFNLCGIRNTAILQEHMESAKMAANLLNSRWSAQGVNLWAVDLQTVPLVQGQATYTVPSTTIAMLDTYITVTTGSTSTNRYISPISRTEYASYSNPNSQGFPTTYWFDRLLSPTVTLWPVPDGSETSLNYYRVRQIQDSNFAGGANVEVPFYFLEAYALGLAQRLAMIWAPDKASGLKLLADESYTIATEQNVENSNWYISPQIGSYFRV
jgi:hypothetical protein